MYYRCVIAVAVGGALSIAALAVGLGVFSKRTVSCFCCQASQTLAEEMAAMEIVAIARLTHVQPPSNDDDPPRGIFEIIELHKGKNVRVGDKIDTIFFGEGEPENLFLLMGTDSPTITWDIPRRISLRTRDYLRKIIKLPAKGADRFVFVLEYLEDQDELLAHDAFDELKAAPHSTLKKLKPQLNRDQLIAWLQDPELPGHRRRLYFRLLGICGSALDLPMLETALQSHDHGARAERAGLDEQIACYLTLKGESGMELVEERFLKDPQASYPEVYSAILALRFHLTEESVIRRERVLEALKHLLKRAELADLVIPDLAEGKDWSVVEELFELFKNADEKTIWVRVPVIQYLRKCPLPRAKVLLQECEQIDPATMKRAETFFFETSPGT